MPVWTALGTKSRMSVASVGLGSAASPEAPSPSPSSPAPHAVSATATASAARTVALGAGGIVNREPGDAHVDALSLERRPLGVEQLALAVALRERAIGADHPLPRHLGVVASRHHRACEARRLGTQI